SKVGYVAMCQLPNWLPSFLGRQLQIVRRDRDRRSHLRHLAMGLPQDAIDEHLPKGLLAEVRMEMAEHAAERSAMLRIGAFVSPGDGVDLLVEFDLHDRRDLFLELELRIEFVAQIVFAPASANRMLRIDLL